MYKDLYLKYKWYILITLPMSILLGMLSISVIAIISEAIGNNLQNLEYDAVYFFSVISVLFLLGLSNEWLRAKLLAHVIYDIQIKMIRRVIATPLAQLEKIGIPKVIATLTQDLSTAINYFHALPVLFVNIAIIICGVAYMAYLSVELLAVVLGFILVGGVTITALVLFTKKDRANIREATDDMMSHYQNVVHGAKELALHTPRKVFLSQKIYETAAGMRKRTRRVLNVLAVVEQWGQWIVFAMLGCVIFFVDQFFTLSTEIILGYVMTLLFLLEPIEVITTKSNELVEAKVAFEKIDSLKLAGVDGWQGVSVKKTDLTIRPVNQLVLESVEYAYTQETEKQTEMFHLGPISACFNAGEVTLIIGGNGSGKSTLLKVLSGLYSVDSGTIKLNGKIITAQEIETFRNHFSMITPDFCLFQDALNAQGEPCNDDKVNQVLALLKLENVINCTHSRLSSLDLSHGQRKRVALMQSYFEDKPIVLLDEWAADQDPTFKEIFYKEIVPNLKRQQKIVIVVTHDDKYFDISDRVLKLSDGKLEEFYTQAAADDCSTVHGKTADIC